MRILLDTNILISGILGADSPPALLLDLWRARKFELVTSKAQLEELRRVLARPKISLRLTPGEADRLLSNLEHAAVLAEDLPVVHLSPDPDDNLILATAIAGEADLIVSGDVGGMLELRDASGIPITTARMALERLPQRN